MYEIIRQLEERRARARPRSRGRRAGHLREGRQRAGVAHEPDGRLLLDHAEHGVGL